MSESLIPQEEGKLAAWLDNLAARIGEFATALGITAEKKESVSNDSLALSHLIKQTEIHKTAATTQPEAYRHLVDYKNFVKNGASEALRKEFPEAFTDEVAHALPGVLPRLFALIDRLRNAPGYTQAIGQDLDIAFDTGIATVDHIPTGDNELLGWMDTFLKKLRGHAPVLGVSPTEVERYQKDHDILARLVREVDRLLNDGKRNLLFKELVDYKDFVKYGLLEKVASVFPEAANSLSVAAPFGVLPRLTAWLETVRGNKALTGAMATALGLPALGAVATAAAPIVEAKPTPIIREEKPTPVKDPGATADKGMPWLLPLLGLLFAGGLGWFLWPKGEPVPNTVVASPTPMAEATPAPVATALAEPRPLEEILAARKKDDVLVLYERGAFSWIEPAAEEFNKTQQGGRILLTSRPSREGRDHILYDKDKVQPVLWVPADIYWVDKMQADAIDESIPAKSGATVEEGKALLKTYVVLLMKEDRAKVFETAMKKPEYEGKTWKLLTDIAEKGWSAVGGPAEWGKLKLAHSNPALSNSGMTTLALMFAEFQRNNPGKDINSAEFKKMMTTLEGATEGKFADTTSKVLEMVKETTSAYDIAVIYESDAVKELEKGLTGYRIIYPAPTAVVVLPASVVVGSWADESKTNLANTFVDYLLSEPVQEKAIAVGYRPSTEALEPMVRAFYEAETRKGAGMVVAPKYEGTDVDTKVKEGLIFNWVEWYKATYKRDPMQGAE